MAAYKTAYEHRDSTEMKLLYDDTYTGESIDQSNPQNILHLTFDKTDEVASVAAMARTISITSVTLGWPSALFRETDQADPPGWAMIQLPPSTVRLTVDDSATKTWVIVSDKSSYQFKFIPTTPDSTSPTDTTWKIARWTEIRY